MIYNFKLSYPLPDFHLDDCHRRNENNENVRCDMMELRMLRKVLRSSIRKDLKLNNNKDTHETEDKRRVLFRVEECLLHCYNEMFKTSNPTMHF